MQLTKGMYGTEFNNSSDATFGLRCGQMCYRDQLTHNSGWYNGSGEKLGFGDLSADNMLRIFIEIEPGEMFMVLSENDSFWQSNTRDDQKVDVECPGVDYVVEKAMYAITNWGIFALPARYSHLASDTCTLRGVGEVPVISRDELRGLLAAQKV